MRYIEVEMRDSKNERTEYHHYVFSDFATDEDIAFDENIYHDFDNFIDAGVNTNWAEEELEEYCEDCEWYWYDIDNDMHEEDDLND